MSYTTIPFFSIIVPLYNKENEIKKTIESILQQIFPNIEIIIVNDGSTDGSLKIVELFKDKRIKIINGPNSGVSHARNKGIFAAKGQYIALLDADDFWSPLYLLEIKHLIDKYTNCKIFATDYTISPLGFYNKMTETHTNAIVTDYFSRAMYIPFLTASSIVVNRICFDDSIKFNENYSHGEDLDLWLRLFKKYNSIAYSDQKLVCYNHDANNRACSVTPTPEKHFAFHLNLGGNTKERQYNVRQICILELQYLKKFKFMNFLSVILKHKSFIFNILYGTLALALFNEYKIRLKQK